MSRFRSTPARTALGQVLDPLLPKTWQIVEDETTVDDNEKVRVRLSQQAILHSDTGYTPDHRIEFKVSITVPTESLAAAERDLDDDMDAFLFALDDADVPWDRAEKGRFGDENGRLGYQVTITIRTTKEETE